VASIAIEAILRHAMMKQGRSKPHDNKIDLSFERAIEKLLATPPKKKPT
jgi:hypothetical protein